MSGWLRVLATGPGSTIQDLGRPGWFSSGVGVAGAADTVSFRLANRLVGNPEGAAGVECLLGGLILRAEAAVTLAVTGATAPISVDATPVGAAAVLRLAAGQTLALGLAEAGLRVYVAVRGGLAVQPVLGSRSRDTMAGIGPEPLAVGDRLPVGPPPPGWTSVEVAPVATPPTGPLTLRTIPGPRADWFRRPGELCTGHWVVTDRLDRVGVRLARPDGLPALERSITGELPTEGMPVGAIQVPPSGEPVIFLADHPITGGYPVIAVLHSSQIAAAAQARPGQQVRFHHRG